VVGAGAMGSGIAQVAAAAGHAVVLYDNSSIQVEQSKNTLQQTLTKLTEKGKYSIAVADGIFERITFSENISSLKNCGLIVEAIVENIEIKKALFTELEEIVSADCVLATNTSSLSITSIASTCKIASRVIGIHFFNPAPIMPLVEIIPGITTNNSVAVACKNLIDSWGKTTVIAKDSPGFIVNRVARCFYGESIRLYEEGIADFATIDWAMKTFGGFKMGPFELMDFIGNDVNFKVTETIWEQFFFEPRFKPSLTQKRMFEAKHFGRKSGKGYYDYSEGAILPKPNTNNELGLTIFHRVIVMLMNEAADALYLGLATRDDIDTAMTKGVNYPKGLLKWADELGITTVCEILQQLHVEYGEERYRTCVLLKRMNKEGKTFY
jgi:3-hydroxybutyryl-CoA dehydrogenase